MERTIYADVYFLINFSMDFLCLFITSKIAHKPIKNARMILAATVGGIYAVIDIAFPGSVLLGWILNIALPFLLCYIAFGAATLRSLISCAVTFWGSAFVSGGMMSALYYLCCEFLGDRNISIGGSVKTVYREIPLWIFALLAVICAVISIIWGRISGRRRNIGSAQIEITVFGNTITANALVDSGNLLVEPLGGTPVILLCESLCKKILPPAVERLLSGGNTSGCEEYISKIRVIPFNAASGSGIMYALMADKVMIGSNEVSACIGIDKTDRDFAGFEAILPSNLL